MYTLKYEKQAKKDLKKLERGERQRIVTKLEWFSQHPERSRNVKYIDKYNCLRYRIGKFRAFFEKDKEDNSIRIFTIEKRSKVYK